MLCCPPKKITKKPRAEFGMILLFLSLLRIGVGGIGFILHYPLSTFRTFARIYPHIVFADEEKVSLYFSIKRA